MKESYYEPCTVCTADKFCPAGPSLDVRIEYDSRRLTKIRQRRRGAKARRARKRSDRVFVFYSTVLVQLRCT